MSLSELLMLPATVTVPMGHSVQWKNFIQAFAGTSLWRKRCSASLTCQQYFLVSYGYITSIYMKYRCNVDSIYNVHPVEIFCLYSFNLFDMHRICMVYAMLIHTIYLLYTWHIQYISNRIFLYIQF